ncbi:Uu.00g137200.m01.CDS01 [Anthostomella pinea]|uniref:Uu.00g137200.m01.CDS01 n=1 Tax=Anthostomella pinea TaxID=933095 RepID=A0AAI8VQ40_9PEZI|nr:Uu.00g137200.m01.CDS01 [Anthostomella pinea]
MATPLNRKRQRADDGNGAQGGHPCKKIKSGRSHHRVSNFSPEFWDNLSKVWLTPRALRELDRRNSIRPPMTTVTPEEVYSKDLARFARHGGPDLRHLRGCPEPSLDMMASSRSSRYSGSSRNTRTTNATSFSPSSRKLSASSRGPEFEQHLQDYGIYLAGYDHPDDRETPEPSNLGEIHWDLLATRASLSPSHFPDSAFRDFSRKNTRVVLESDVMDEIVPILCGNAVIPSKKNVVFTELEPITDGTASRPQPDFFDGSHLRDIDNTVRKDESLYPLIIPTKHPTVPVAPNFFLEAKRQDGSAAVMKRQACYDGAYGARAMHGLQNYGSSKPVYDNNAYSLSSTYHAGTGTLQLYAHHPTAPTAPGDRPEYHMTQVKAFAMTSDRNTFVDGATAFRNARDMASGYRNEFIATANSRVVQTHLLAQNDASPAIANAAYTSQTAHDDLQQDIFNQSIDFNALPPYLNTDDDSQYPIQEPAALDGDPSTSFITSFTSDFSSTGPTSKRPRQSYSPPSSVAETSSAKSRSRPSTRSQTKSHWVETYRRNGKLCFNNLHDQEIETRSREWKEQDADGTSCFYWKSPKSGRVFWTSKLA